MMGFFFFQISNSIFCSITERKLYYDSKSATIMVSMVSRKQRRQMQQSHATMQATLFTLMVATSTSVTSYILIQR